MLSNNIPTTFSVEERDFPPVSRQSELNFNVHSHVIHSLIIVSHSLMLLH